MIPESLGANKGWLRRPRLRPVEAFPVRLPEGEALCLRDPGRVAPEMLFLTPEAAVVLVFFTGERGWDDIKAAVRENFHREVELESIAGLAELLDRSYFLEGPTFRDFFQREKERFAQSPVREAVLSGSAYPADAEALTRRLASFAAGPSDSEEVEEAIVPADPPRGLVAPHIDFARGGPCYAVAYRRLSPLRPPDLVVILGTAHNPTNNFLSLCVKDFATPFGPARVDRDLAEELLSRIGPSLLEDEFVHRGEHSVEFQAVWLMNLFSGAGKMRVLPLLCGSLSPLISAGRTPWDDGALETSLMVLRGVLDRYRAASRGVMVLASADLSHVGPQFGDEFVVSPETAEKVREYDLELLAKAAAGDYRAFFHHAALNRDRTHVCGLSPIYALLRLTGEAKGRLLAYEQWVDEQGQGLVSFAGLVFP
ncbi:MAG: AmmeMemoRadiSam system protein B [Pseudomonadota bacterium]